MKSDKDDLLVENADNHRTSPVGTTFWFNVKINIHHKDTAEFWHIITNILLSNLQKNPKNNGNIVINQSKKILNPVNQSNKINPTKY